MTVSIVAEGPSFRILDESAEETFTARREAGEDQDPEDSEAIVADKQSKIYYSKGCRPAYEIKESDRVIFKSGEEAEAAGYKPAKQCSE